MLVGALLALAAWMAFIRVFVVRAKRFGIDSASRILFVVGYFVHLLLYLKFAYDYPQECSMHFSIYGNRAAVSGDCAGIYLAGGDERTA